MATGHWGCGAFGGDIYCKFPAQWIAASISKVSLVYCLVGRDSDMVQKDLQAIVGTDHTGSGIEEALHRSEGDGGEALLTSGLGFSFSKTGDHQA